MAWVARQWSRVRGRGRPVLAVAHERAVAAGAPRVLAVKSSKGEVVGDVRPTDYGLVLYVRDTLTETDPDPAALPGERAAWGRKRPVGATVLAVVITDDVTVGAWCPKAGRRAVFTTTEVRDAIDANKSSITIMAR